MRSSSVLVARRAQNSKLKDRPTKTKVISRQWGYHGVTLAAMCATGISSYWPMFEPRIPGFVHIPSPYPYRYEAPPGTSQGSRRFSLPRTGRPSAASILATCSSTASRRSSPVPSPPSL